MVGSRRKRRSSDSPRASSPESSRLRADYLKVWFLAELARSPGDVALRADQGARARAAAAEFAGAHPASELRPAVSALVSDLPGAGSPP